MSTPKKPYLKPTIVSEGSVADLTKALIGHVIVDSGFPANGNNIITNPITTGPLQP